MRQQNPLQRHLDRQLLKFIDTFVRDRGYCPSTREMSAGIDRATSATNLRLRSLAEEGLITSTDGVMRSTRLTEKGEHLVQS